MSLVETEHKNGVVLVTLNRPEKRNALSIQMREQIEAAFSALATADSVQCIVLTGAGTAFCAGMDVTQFGGDREHKKKLVASSTGAFRAVGSCPKPVVCAVNGPAVAGGFALAMLADIRLASERAVFGFFEMAIGVAASYAALRMVVSPGVARDLCLSGRKVDAEEAKRLGIVSQVCAGRDLMDRAIEMAGRIADLPSHSVLETKRRILYDVEASFGKLLEEEERVFREELLGAKPPR